MEENETQNADHKYDEDQEDVGCNKDKVHVTIVWVLWSISPVGDIPITPKPKSYNKEYI